MAITPLRDNSSQTNPMRRMFSSRSSLLKPSPFERWVRTTSPSSTSTLAFNRRSRCSNRFEIVLLPAPDIPVNQSVNPSCMAHDRSVGRKMDAAFFLGALFPPPAPRPLVFTRAHGARAWRASDAGISAGIKRMHRDVVFPDVSFHLLGSPVGQRTDFNAAVGLFYFRHGSAARRLRAPQPRRPGPQTAQFTRQRTDF